MREKKRNKRGRNKTALPGFFFFLFCFVFFFTARTQTNVVSGALIELAGKIETLYYNNWFHPSQAHHPNLSTCMLYQFGYNLDGIDYGTMRQLLPNHEMERQ